MTGATDKIYIAGISCTKLGKRPDASVKQMVREAVEAALADAKTGSSTRAEHHLQAPRGAAGEGEKVLPWQGRKRYAAFLSYHQRDGEIWKC